jgi:hypothetical protein
MRIVFIFLGLALFLNSGALAQNEPTAEIIFRILPRVNCETLRLVVSNQGDSVASRPQISTCTKVMKKLRYSSANFWPPVQTNEKFSTYYVRIGATAAKLCNKLFRLNKLKIGNIETSGCQFDQPSPSTPFSNSLTELATASKLPDMFLLGSKCTELPLKSQSTMSNADLFGELSNQVGDRADWQKIKAYLLKEGFTEDPHDTNHVTRFNWGVSPNVSKKREIFFAAPTTYEIFQGERHIGQFLNKSCQARIVDSSADCSDYKKFVEAKPLSGLCIELGGIGP